MTFGDYCTVNMGQAPSGEFYNTSGQGLPLLAGAGDMGEIHPTPTRFSSSAPKICGAGEIILCIRATIGKKNWADRSYCLGRGVASITPIKSEEVFSNYIWHWLTANEKNLLNKGKGATFLQISKKDIEDTPCFLPSISEQRRIAAILDKADAIRRKRQQSLKLMDDLVKAQFIEKFGDPATNPMGWEEKRLGGLVKIRSSKRVYQREQTINGVPFLRVSDLTNKIINGVDTCGLYIAEKLYENFIKNDLVPQPGDILVTSRGTLGLCYIVNDSDRFYFQDGMISWLDNRKRKINSTYLSFLFQCHGIKKQIDQASPGSTVKYLSLSNLEDFKILTPPVALQNEFAAFVEQADKTKFSMLNQIRKIETLLYALMQKYFY